MDSSMSEVQFADPGEGSHTNQSKFANGVSSYMSFMDSDDDMQTDGTLHTTKDNTSFKSEDGMDSSDAAYGSYESTSGCLPLPPSENITSTSFDSMKLSSTIESNDEAQKQEEMDAIKLEASHGDDMDMHENSELLVAKSEEMFSVDTLNSEVPCTNEPVQLGENSAVSESVEASTSDETPVKHELEEIDNSETALDLKVLSNEMPADPSLKQDTDVSKLDTLSDDEEVSFPKSGAESSSSKDESPSRPSCSGTSHRDLNSLSSDSEADLPDINMTLPLKKRKRDSLVETISSSSCSEDEAEGHIDYENLTPDQIKALIEQAKNIKHKCLCPKRKWADLPVKGPTQPPKHCHVGKGDWREKHPCTECLGGVCTEAHKPGRSGRKRYTHTRSALAKTRLRGTIGQDVPIVPVIELSDEEGSPVSNRVASEVTITTAPAGECIVLSSSDDDSDIVCEGVIKAKPKPQEPKTLLEGSYLLSGSPDVVVLSVPSADGAPAAAAAAAALAPPTGHATPPPLALPVLPAAPVPTDLDLLWPELDNYTWNEMNFLCDNIIGPPNMGGMAANANTSQATASAAVPERPASPEGWSCPICLESKTAVPEIMSTTCGHIFCGTCIRSAVRIHKKCPTCRKKLTAKQFHKIFL